MTALSPVTRPAVRWHGGKYLLAPWIIAHMPAHRVYVEPFGGGGNVLIRKQRAYAEIYNDLDGKIVNVFRVLRERGEELRRQLELTPFARDEFDMAYEPSDDALEAARRMVIRCFMGFGTNGYERVTGFRANSNRRGTTPAHDWKNYADALPVLIERLRGIVIENRDAKEVLAQHDAPTTLHYVDPPYVMETRGDTTKDYAHELSLSDHRILLALLRALKGYVMLSGYDHDLYTSMLGDWTLFKKETFADGARPRTECLWLNPAAAAAVQKSRLL